MTSGPYGSSIVELTNKHLYLVFNKENQLVDIAIEKEWIIHSVWSGRGVGLSEPYLSNTGYPRNHKGYLHISWFSNKKKYAVAKDLETEHPGRHWINLAVFYSSNKKRTESMNKNKKYYHKFGKKVYENT